MQFTAPGFVAVLVRDPASQLVHVPDVDTVEYFPGTHIAQSSAPGAVPWLVIDPASQGLQDDWVLRLWNSPAAHKLHCVWLVWS